ncbi:A/G-specific adenine glycosylase [Soonwooa sp.]|uniref:A/G-specific adenine glycosylase n=1 Tax=Soonwooa sp. TaxID=1938592 RepID=UPI00289B57E0|nr:A/G-specific adenine glycosylase [Soonwooa sp.]
MKTYKQKTDFLYIGVKLLKWYQTHKRDLPWRKSINPYNIWISEVVLQQTQVKQGMQHYLNFVERFPDVDALANADEEEVLLYWKGLGYYSRALNLHKAAKQLVVDYNSEFPKTYSELLKLKGVGKYTAAAIASISFLEKVAAVDGNFYRVLSRLFADDFDISNSRAFQYFSELAELIMPEKDAGCFNQAMMDLGSEVCKPKNPLCSDCPLQDDCHAFAIGKINQFPVKLKKTKVENLALSYQFVYHDDQFLVKQRDTSDIWKKLFEFPKSLDFNGIDFIEEHEKVIQHKLTHRNLEISISKILIPNKSDFDKLKTENDFLSFSFTEAEQKSFPKPLHDYYIKYFSS